MATQLQIRRGTSSQVAAFTGAEGEIVVNTTNDSIHVNDGSSAGGFEMARADLNNVSDTDLNAALTGNTVSALTVTSLTSSGIDVTGTVTADAVEVDGLLHIDGSDNANVAKFALTRTDASWSINNETNFRIYGTTGDTTSPATKRFEIGTGGDISFYEDTGTTPKLFWDASAESLGINDTTPENKLTVVDTDGGSGIAVVKARTPTTNGRASYQIGNDADNWFMGIDGGNSDAFFIADAVGSSDKLVITQGGNVGIGTSSPQYITEIAKSQAGGVGPTLYLHNTVDNVATGHAAEIRFNLRSAEATTRNAAIQAVAEGSYGTSPALTFLTSSGSGGSATERMRISSAGYVTTPQNPYFRGSYNGSNLAATAVIPQNGNIANRNMTHSGGNTITVPVTGRYLIAQHQLGVASGAQTCIRINGVNLAGSFTQHTGGNNGSITTVLPIELNASDFVQFVVIAGSIHGNPSYSVMSVTFIG